MEDEASEAATPETPAAPIAPVTTDALTTIINLLKPLTSEDRQRTVGAAMMFLGEAPLSKPKLAQKDSKSDDSDEGDDTDEGDYSAHIKKWMKQNDVSSEELDQVFHFNDDDTFDLLHSPGKTKKEQTINIYTLTGLGKYLAANDRSFDDTTARAFCEKMGCFDKSNHSTHLHVKNRPEFTGDKSKGYSLTNPGIKRGAALVKEVSGAAK
jgi:hypothetical protein